MSGPCRRSTVWVESFTPGTFGEEAGGLGIVDPEILTWQLNLYMGRDNISTIDARHGIGSGGVYATNEEARQVCAKDDLPAGDIVVNVRGSLVS